MTDGPTDAAAPLVVLLHGRGSTEREILSLAPHLPHGLAYAAVRAPIADGGGFAWFANHGIGRPDAASLSTTMGWFTRWLDDVAPPGRPVFLIGFSGGAAFAGGLVLANPSRYVGAAILYGTMPFDAGLAVDTGRLANLPMFVAQGEADQVIPRDLLDRTWDYLLKESGAPTVARRDAGGHRITAATLHRLSSWLADRVRFLAAHEPAPTGVPGDVAWPLLPARRYRTERVRGPRCRGPSLSSSSRRTPQPSCRRSCSSGSAPLKGISTSGSHISVQGAARSSSRPLADQTTPSWCPGPGVRPPPPRLRRLATPRPARTARGRPCGAGLGDTAPVGRDAARFGLRHALRAAHERRAQDRHRHRPDRPRDRHLGRVLKELARGKWVS